MKRALLIGAMALAGCSVDNESVNSYSVKQHNATTGLTLLPSENMWVSFEEMNTIYTNTEACMGMWTYGPTVRFTNFMEVYGYIGGWGFYTPTGDGHIFINTYDSGSPAGIERDKYTDTETLKHEYVHHILAGTGNDWHHGDPMFAKCGPGPNVSN